MSVVGQVTFFPPGRDEPVTRRLNETKTTIGLDSENDIQIRPFPRDDDTRIHAPKTAATVAFNRDRGLWEISGRFRRFDCESAIRHLQLPSVGCRHCYVPFFDEASNRSHFEKEFLSDGDNVVFVVESCRARDRWKMCHLAHLQFSLSPSYKNHTSPFVDMALLRFVVLPVELQERIFDLLPAVDRLVSWPAVDTEFYFISRAWSGKTRQEVVTREIDLHYTAEVIKNRVKTTWQKSILFFDPAPGIPAVERGKMLVEVDKLFHSSLEHAEIASHRLAITHYRLDNLITPSMFQNLTTLKTTDSCWIPLAPNNFPFKCMKSLTVLRLTSADVMKPDGFQASLVKAVARGLQGLMALSIKAFQDVEGEDWREFFSYLVPGVTYLDLNGSNNIPDECQQLAVRKFHKMYHLSF